MGRILSKTSKYLVKITESKIILYYADRSSRKTTLKSTTYIPCPKRTSLVILPQMLET